MKRAIEYLDVLNPDGAPTGIRKPRADIHRGGDWHKALHIWIVKEGRYILFQRRSPTKDLEPLKLDVSIGGHLQAGETIKDALREAEEELGLSLRLKDLHYLGTRPTERYYPQAIDREFHEIYAIRNDQPLEAYLLNPEEVYVLYELSLAGALALYREGKPLAAAGYDCYGRHNNALLIEADLIAQAREEVIWALLEIEAWLKG